MGETAVSCVFKHGSRFKSCSFSRLQQTRPQISCVSLSDAEHACGAVILHSSIAACLQHSACRSPVKEVVYAVRAISPLLVALVLLVVVVLRQPLPSQGFSDEEGAFSDSEQKSKSKKGATESTGTDREDLDSAKQGSGLGKNAASDVEQGYDQVQGW